MTFKPTILNISTGLFIVEILLYTVFNYRQLAESEGWGIVAMVGLFGVCAILLLIDFIVQQVFKSRKTVNIISAFITIAATLLLLLK